MKHGIIDRVIDTGIELKKLKRNILLILVDQSETKVKQRIFQSVKQNGKAGANYIITGRSAQT